MPGPLTTGELLMAALVLMLGCTVGSFLNVCIWRLPRGLSISAPPRSICPRCGAPIRAADNIPLLSYIVLGGRCRSCGGSISWHYPLVEGLTGVLFALMYLLHGAWLGVGGGQVIIMCLLAALLIAASGIDMKWFIIPDEISLFGILGGLLAGLLLPGLHVGDAPYHTYGSLTGIGPLDGVLGAAIGAAAAGLLVLAFALFGAVLFRKEAMGIGDVKLMAMVGAFMGWKVALLSFFLAPFFGLLYGLPLLVMKKEHVMPYGPFLSAAGLLVMLLRPWSCAVLEHYLHLAGELLRILLGGL